MIRKLMSALNPRRRSLRSVSRLLDELESNDSATSQRAKETLTSIYYCQFGYQPSIWQWAEYWQFVRENRDWLRIAPVVRPLLAALEGNSKAARLFAIKALAANQVRTAIDGIVAALQDESGETRAAAASSLFHYRDRRTVEPLIAALSDAELEPRIYAAGTLSFIADPRAKRPLEQMLESNHWQDRRAALYALIDFCDEYSLPAIHRCLKDPAKRVRKAAKSALAGYDRRRRKFRSSLASTR
jgi:HEAT repeat protein